MLHGVLVSLAGLAMAMAIFAALVLWLEMVWLAVDLIYLQSMTMEMMAPFVHEPDGRMRYTASGDFGVVNR